MHAVQIHTNVVGGMSMSEPANDLAIAVAIASSYFEQPIARDIVCIGEIGETPQSVALLLCVILPLLFQSVRSLQLSCRHSLIDLLTSLFCEQSLVSLCCTQATRCVLEAAA